MGEGFRKRGLFDLYAGGVAWGAGTCDGVANCLGVYFDSDGTQTCRGPAAAMESFHLYFVLQSADDLGEFDAIEFGWRFEPAAPDILVLSATMPPCQVCDVPNFPYNFLFCSGCGPVPVDGPTLIADVQLLAFTAFAAGIRLGPAVPASLPGHGAIMTNDPSRIEPLGYACPVDADGWTLDAVAILGDCEVAAAPTRWGSVKALYR